LPGARLVKAFNAISAYRLRSEAHREGDRQANPSRLGRRAGDQGGRAVGRGCRFRSGHRRSARRRL